MNALGLILALHEYDAWATRLAYGSIRTVPAGAHGAPAYGRVLEVAAHIQVARRVWLERLHGRAAGPGIDFFPRWGLDRTESECAALDRAWGDYLGGLTETALESEIRYTASDKARFASRVPDVLLHVANHGTYHRGQIARLVTECGGARATTDLVARTRVAIERSPDGTHARAG